MISVIVPIYNNEKKLNQCIKSIIGQSEQEIEIILVNDGSTDGSLEICREYEKKDDRIRVINKENAGVSAARNTGIEKAKGEYIQFVDSDDYVEKDMCKTLREAMESTKADMVISGFHHIYMGKDIPKVPQESLGKILHRQGIGKHFLELYAQGFLNMPWNKLYKKEVIREKFKEDVSLGEDLMFNLAYMEHVQKLALVSVPLYYYIQERGRANLSAQKREDKLDIAKQICRASEAFYHKCLGQNGGEEIIYSRMVSEFLCEIAESVYDKNITRKEFALMVEKYRSDDYLKKINQNIKNLPVDLRILNFFFRKKGTGRLWILCRLRKMAVEMKR